VVSLQNGLNAPEIARRIGSSRTIGGRVDFSADYHEPGVIALGRRSDLYVGELDGRMTARLEEVHRLLGLAVPTRATANVKGYVWSKCCKGSMDVTTALVDATIGEVRGHKPTQRALVEVVREGVQVARAEGIRLEPFDHFAPAALVDVAPAGLTAAYQVLDEMARAAAGDRKVRTGYWRDSVVRKRQTEIFALTGDIVRRGERLGIPTPVNRRQLELFDEIEAGQRPMRWANLDELLGKVPVDIEVEDRPRDDRRTGNRHGIGEERQS
jgi:2-dehydropantoate 2-reductase